MSKGKKIMLMSSDKEIFEVEESVAKMSQTIKHMIEDNCANQVIPVANVTGSILAKVIEYCKQHVAEDPDEVVLTLPKDYAAKKRWNTDFLDVDHKTLFDLTMAANYLSINSLLTLTCQKVAEMIKGKTVEQLHRILNIKNDFTPEEEEQIRRENHWAFNH